MKKKKRSKFTSEVVLVNFKINQVELDRMKKNADEYTKGNLSALIRFGALHPSEELKRNFAQLKNRNERLL